jgi:non-ribosomal peptide synthetase component E (peptide arylation enzyme)
VLTDGSAETRTVAERVLAGLASTTPALRFDGKETEALYQGPAPEEPQWDPDPAAPLVVLVSSGTTGAPKLVARSHRGFGGASRRFGELWGARPGVRFAVGSMVGHAAALGWGVQAALMAGATLVIPVDRRPAALWESLARLEAQVVFLVPSQGRALLAALRADPALAAPALRRVIFGGERLEPALAHGLRERLGVEVQNTYGMTEGFCTSTDPASLHDIDEESVGRPCLAEDELRVLDESGAEVSPGAVGELWVRGPACAQGYLGLPSDPRFSPDGFFRTGDLVRQLADGRLVTCGRVSTLINRGGIKVSPEELEHGLQQHPAVEQALVVGVRDERLGERVCALVRARPPLSSGDELRRFLERRGVGRSLLPDRIHLVDSLPLTSIGKLDRRAAAGLAATLNTQSGAGTQDART